MSSVAGIARLSAAVSSRSLRHKLLSRGFRSTTTRHAASNYLMPAMSPTMSEGNIASWKVQEGSSFSAGDVLLEIETDKAQMDVEAQEDGVLAKIMQSDGAKNVKVGARIAVMAEEGDDLSSLEIPPDEQAAPSQPPPPQEKAPEPPKQESASKEKQQPAAAKSADHPREPSSGQAQEQTYPLYPSVMHLMKTNNIPLSDASKIPATGPAGRLLKGDVLSYLNAIPASYSAELSARLSKLSHLDLSNIKRITPAKPAPAAVPASDKAPPAEDAPPTQIAVPIDLRAVLETQARIRQSLGLELPLSTFIARASELANEDLPRPRAPPSADALFDAVLGLDQTPARRTSSRGTYTPQITALAPPPPSVSRPRPQTPKVDLFDELTAPDKRRATPAPSPAAAAGVVANASGKNVFSVAARRGEEARARTYLERVKTVLERDTARLVL